MLDEKFLKKIPIFKGLDYDKLGSVRAIIKEKTFEAGELIIQDGTIGDRMYVLLDGEVEISKPLVLKVATSSTDAHDKSLTRLSSRDFAFFGEVSLFHPEGKRSANVIAVKKSRLGEMERETFLHLAESDKEIGYTILRNVVEVLSTRLDKANQDILKLATALSLVLER